MSSHAIELETVVMPGQVIEDHADIESDCSNCHKAFARDKQSALCMDCHEDIADDVDNRRGYHGRDPQVLAQKCADCHADHLGREVDIVGLDTATFRHHLTDFSLETGHQDVACEDCHAVDEKFRDAPSICFECHADDDEHRGGLGEDCESCHVATTWKETEFEHEAETGYALSGGHRGVECAACHIDQSYENTPTDCYDCHKTDDSHNGLNGTDCAFCHITLSWAESIFDHSVETSFPLLGRHGKITCNDCHVENKFAVNLETECITCHRNDDEHKGLNGEDCGECHSSSDWSESLFRHEIETDFPLLGAHAVLECADCHEQPVHDVLLETDCYACHQPDDAHEDQLGKNCGACHNEIAWTDHVRFDHGLTSFPLLGSHQDAACVDCHETSRFKDAPDDCVGCHLTDDVHENRLGPDCAICHIPGDWSFWDFNHNRQTRFALDGAHVDILCEACHTKPMKSGVQMSMSCGSCHRRDDVHAGEFGADCGRCHTTRNFRDVTRIGR